MVLSGKYTKEADMIFATLQDQPKSQTPRDIEICKKLIYCFLATFKYFDYDETRKLIPKDYKQHNPTVGDGGESIIEFAELTMQQVKAVSGSATPPEVIYKHLCVSGEFLFVHAHVIRWPGDRGLNAIDLFRYDDGKFTEHWDSVTEIPETCKNSNGLF